MPAPTLAEFNKLTPARKRMAIAADVLATLKIRSSSRYLVEQGKYFYASYNDTGELDLSDVQQLQKVLPKLRKHCEVRAMGAMFLSHVKIANEVTVREVRESEECNIWADNEFIADKMSGYFTAQH